MEDELKCASCQQFYSQPVLLPCFHSMCLECALHSQQPVTLASLPGHHAPTSSSVSELSELSTTDCNDSDKLSVLSETDSGVVVNSVSRPNSFIGAGQPPPPAPGQPSAAGAVGPVGVLFSLACPSCRKLVYFDEHGAQNLPRYRAMQTIVDKYVESKTLGVACQLCEPGNQAGNQASVFCEQCQVFYCDGCRESCHPARGPLAKHSLISPHQGRIAARSLKEKLKVPFLSLSLSLFRGPFLA